MTPSSHLRGIQEVECDPVLVGRNPRLLAVVKRRFHSTFDVDIPHCIPASPVQDAERPPCSVHGTLGASLPCTSDKLSRPAGGCCWSPRWGFGPSQLWGGWEGVREIQRRHSFLWVCSGEAET